MASSASPASPTTWKLLAQVGAHARTARSGGRRRDDRPARDGPHLSFGTRPSGLSSLRHPQSHLGPAAGATVDLDPAADLVDAGPGSIG